MSSPINVIFLAAIVQLSLAFDVTVGSQTYEFQYSVKEEESNNKERGWLLALLIQGIATSIDALSVGFDIYDYSWIEALESSGIIAIVTFAICMGGLYIGKKFGMKLGRWAPLLGGIILLGIGLEIFISSMLETYHFSILMIIGMVLVYLLILFLLERVIHKRKIK